jgi:cytidylate kinase
MVRLITVEREYGSGGAEFAHHLAKRLQWKFIDQCMIEEIAQKTGVAPSELKRCDERLDPWYYRFGKAFWHGSLNRLPAQPDGSVFDGERMVEFVREYLTKTAESGNCVVVGRGAACILSALPGAFHVFVYASTKRKVQWFEKNFPEHRGEAEQELEATDKRRAAYVRSFHDADWTDRRLYHLMMNSCMGFDAMVGATVNAAGLTRLVPEAAVAGD